MFAATLDRMEQEFTNRGKLEGKLEGKVDGKVDGKVEGKLEGKKEIAFNLLKSGYGIENTSRITGLSIEDLNEIDTKN